MSLSRRASAAVAVALVLGVSLSGCGQPPPVASDHRPSGPVAAEGVLLAAVLLSTADIEAAVAEGLVTPDEVDEARRAIKDGTLDQWRELAEK